MKTIAVENIRNELLRIRTMTEDELRLEWLQVLGTAAPPLSPAFLRRKLAYKVQEQQFGGLAEEDKKKIEVIGDAPKPKRNQAGIVVGTILERIWKKKTYTVIAREDGFELNGQSYRSLSGVANAITGTSWNGKKFFGVQS